MNIEEILQKYDLPHSMAVRHNDPSGWMTPFAVEAQGICSASQASFVFLESQKMQAVAVQDSLNLVGVYAGMFWILCRLASSVAAGGIFPTLQGVSEPTWKPDLERSLRTPRDLLDEGQPFDWELEKIGWSEAGERQILFHVVLSLCFRFVVLHEVGHIENDHSRRRQHTRNNLLLVDRPNPRLIQPSEAYESQARELIADGFAFQHLVRIFDNQLTQFSDLEYSRIIREHLVADAPSLIRFTLCIIFLYFRLSDRSDWHTTPLNRLSHPPAPFRMKALFALLIEAKPFGINEEQAGEIISETIVLGDALASVVFDVYPQPDWIKRISTPDHDCHFNKIYEQFGNWSGRLSTV